MHEESPTAFGHVPSRRLRRFQNWLIGLLLLSGLIVVVTHRVEIGQFTELARQARPLWLWKRSCDGPLTERPLDEQVGTTRPDSTQDFQNLWYMYQMYSNFSSFSRRGPDNITEELVVALSGSKSYEFKALFTVIYAALRARNAASGGEEMLRLRTYDKLQNLVRQGQVKKTAKKYKGVTKALLLLSESLKEFRKNGPSFPPRRSLARQ